MASRKNDVQRRFQEDVKDHRLEVVLDAGLHRHLKFRRPGTIVMWFDIVTWPGGLLIDGDMGTFAFRSRGDMLAFFRREAQQRPVDAYYWGQKLIAMDRDGTHEYDADAFRAAVHDDLNQYLEDEPDDPDLRAAVEREVLACADDGEHGAISAAMDFAYKGKQVFPDFYEHRLQEPTYQYLWCLRAIPWAVAAYDRHATAPEAVEPAPASTTTPETDA